MTATSLTVLATPYHHGYRQEGPVPLEVLLTTAGKLLEGDEYGRPVPEMEPLTEDRAEGYLHREDGIAYSLDASAWAELDAWRSAALPA